MVNLDAAQTRNFRAALAVCPDEATRVRAAFAAWTESRGYVYANGGLNTSKSPGVTASTALVLRSSQLYPFDRVGNNGRSVGMYQQIPVEAGGWWGDMRGCMDPAESTRRFLRGLVVTDDPVYEGNLVTPTGSRRVKVRLSSPIAADVLRVQQPLADEAESSNYNAAQVRIAVEIAALFTPTPARSAADWLRLFAAAI